VQCDGRQQACYAEIGYSAGAPTRREIGSLCQHEGVSLLQEEGKKRRQVGGGRGDVRALKERSSVEETRALPRRCVHARRHGEISAPFSARAESQTIARRGASARVPPPPARYDAQAVRLISGESC